MSNTNTCEFPRCNYEARFCFADEPNVPRFCEMHCDNGMVSLKTCEYPRCAEAPLYTFVDDICNPHFCARHKSHGMILANGVDRAAATEIAPDATGAIPAQFLPPADTVDRAVPTATAVPYQAQPAPATYTTNSGPSQASLELAYAYFALKPEHDSLDHIKGDATEHQKKLDALKYKVKSEVQSIQKTSESIAKLEKQIQSQESKWINCFGKSIFGMGLLMKDEKVVEKKAAALKKDEQKMSDLKDEKAKDESALEAINQEQNRLNELVDIRKALEARVQELRSTCLEYEGTRELRRLQSKYQNHQHMHESLQWCQKDVAEAHQLFQKALQTQAMAARSNAMAAGVNIGQAIGGGGGRGFGESPGERLMQIRRNRATKQSIEMARTAADKLNQAQNRLNNDLRVQFAQEMAGVGVIQVPDLWHGSFFRDFLVGQAAGNIGDAINQGRAMAKIRKNMETLESIIASCAQQQQQLQNVSVKLDMTTSNLKDQVFREEKTILDGVIAAAQRAQAAQDYGGIEVGYKAQPAQGYTLVH